MLTAGASVFLGVDDPSSNDKLYGGTVVQAGDRHCLARFGGCPIDLGPGLEVSVFCDTGTFMRQPARIEQVLPDGVALTLLGPPADAERRRASRVSFLSQFDRAFRELIPA